jgi:hypothetical protein
MASQTATTKGSNAATIATIFKALIFHGGGSWIVEADGVGADREAASAKMIVTRILNSAIALARSNSRVQRISTRT